MPRDPQHVNQWLYPRDAGFGVYNRWRDAFNSLRNCISLIFFVSAAAAGIAALIINKEMKTDNSMLYWFIVLTLICDAAVHLLIGFLMCMVGLLYGESSVAAAGASTAILGKLLTGLVYYSTAAVGSYIIQIKLREIGHHLSQKHLSQESAEDFIHPLYLHDLLAAFYVFVVTLISIAQVIRSFPSVIGAIKYLIHKIHHRATRQPVVQFLSVHQTGDPFYRYPAMAEYEMSLSKLADTKPEDDLEDDLLPKLMSSDKRPSRREAHLTENHPLLVDLPSKSPTRFSSLPSSDV